MTFSTKLLNRSHITKGHPKKGDLPPYIFSFKKREIAYDIFKSTTFDYIPHTTDRFSLYAVQLKQLLLLMTMTNFTNSKLNEINEEICTRSINENGFNERYSKLYKYTRQCLWASHWDQPDDFPFQHDGICNAKTWEEWRFLLKGKNFFMTPEIVIPDTLLFPWDEPTPEAIEILEEDINPTPNLDMDVVRKILRELLVDSGNKISVIDFAISQTDTHVCARHDTILEAKKSC
jgi:hypothetical protein